MIKFIKTLTGMHFEYKADRLGNGWAWNELKTTGSVNISSVFYFEKNDLINPPEAEVEDLEDHTYKFLFGVLENNYIKIRGRILGIDNDVFLASDIKFKRALFAAERNISIFGRLAELLDHKNPIIIGGTHKGAIPSDAFDDLLNKFPNTYEVDRYAAARVHAVLSTHLDGMKDARGRYEDYLNKKLKGGTPKLDLEFLKALEVEKYILIRDLIKEALSTKTDISEREWQTLMLSFLLLIFPKYVKVLESVTIHDYYSDPSKKTSRYIDICLIDANGNLDLIEVKKPFEDKIFRRSDYRGNNIPTSELSGSIMQAEKYIFHLSKWGVKGEKQLNAKYGAELPSGMKIRISNPKAIIIVGRDQIGGANMTDGQVLDFEIIKRKYANMIDIITYDDLLRRLNNTIAALGRDIGKTSTP